MRAGLLLAAAVLAGCGERAAEPSGSGSVGAAVEAAPAATASAPAPVASTAAAPAGAAADAAAPATDAVFRYTSLEGCEVLRSNPDEGGYLLERCPGLGGLRLLRSESDGRQSLALLEADGRERQLELPAALGGGFSTLGEQAEWRGRGEGASFRPEALIIRYRVVEDPERPERPTSYLGVIDLDRACVIARVPPLADQNEQARAIADVGSAPCLG